MATRTSSDSLVVSDTKTINPRLRLHPRRLTAIAVRYTQTNGILIELIDGSKIIGILSKRFGIKFSQTSQSGFVREGTLAAYVLAISEGYVQGI